MISDEQLSPAENIRSKQVSALIAAQVLTVKALLTYASGLAEQITTDKAIQLEQLIERYYFTASERLKLNNQLTRWTVLTRIPIPDIDENRLHSGKDVISWLDQLIGENDFYL